MSAIDYHLTKFSDVLENGAELSYLNSVLVYVAFLSLPRNSLPIDPHGLWIIRLSAQDSLLFKYLLILWRWNFKYLSFSKKVLTKYHINTLESLVFLLHKFMGELQREIHISFLVQSSPFVPWAFDMALEPIIFSVICRNFIVKNILCSLLVMLEISLREACTGYECVHKSWEPYLTYWLT